jgi:hypothetical protein
VAYCTIQDLRAEGLRCQDGDARIEALIEEWSDWIDDVTGWWFEQRDITLLVDGTGTNVLFLPAPIIAVTLVERVWHLSDPDQTIEVESDWYVVYDRRPWTSGIDDRWHPKLELLSETSDGLQVGIWARGQQNYSVAGSFGFLDKNGNTPPAIRRACIDLVLAHSKPARRRGRSAADLRERTVQGRAEKYGGPLSSNTASGIPEVDRVLAKYQAPPAMEAA